MRTSKQEEMLDKMVDFVVRKRLEVPFIMTLESMKPMSFLGSQAVAFMEPFLSALFDPESIEEFREMLEDRRNVEELIRRIEAKGKS